MASCRAVKSSCPLLRARSLGARWFALWTLACASGCDMTKLAVNTQADVMARASPVVEEQTDYEFARTSIPATLTQIDGLLRVSPENETLLLLAVRGFASYAYSFIEDDMEQAELSGDYQRADYQRGRARRMYLKAKRLGLQLLAIVEADFPEKLQRDPDTLKQFLDAEFTDASDAPALFWTGYAWGSAINVSRDNPELIADLPFPLVLVERALALDETYYHAAGHVFLGVAKSSAGTSMGGNPEQGRKHFERALALTNRKASIVHVKYAQSYAVQVQDKKLFSALLGEVLAAPITAGTRLSLANTVARRRARRLHSQADTLILEPLERAPTEPPASAEPREDTTPPPEARTTSDEERGLN